MSPSSEDALVTLAKSGDVRAFTELVRLHQPKAVTLAKSLVQDEHDAREIVQEAFIRVFRGFEQFEGHSSFYTWLYRIVSNLAIDFLRRPSRREVEPFDPRSVEERAVQLGLQSPSSDPFHALSSKELKRDIERCVNALPAYHRGVIEMRELDGMSYEEMARAMGVSKGTIMSRLFHARQKLQRSLRENQW